MLLSSSLRRRRSHEWSAGKAVTFIVTLAATRNVTLAARQAGMSRKSAYALKSRDPAFAEAWKEAVTASRNGAPISAEGDDRPRAAPSISAKTRGDAARRLDELRRDFFFARLARLSSDCDDRGAPVEPRA